MVLVEPPVPEAVIEGAAVTVISIEALIDPLSSVAVIVTVPVPTAFTRPFGSTVATEVSLDFHVTRTPDSSLPAESVAVADSCTTYVAHTVVDAELTLMCATGVVGMPLALCSTQLSLA